MAHKCFEVNAICHQWWHADEHHQNANNNNFDLELFAAPSIHSHLLYMETISLVVGYVYLKSVVLQYVEGPLFSDYERGRVLLPQ